MQVLQTKIMPGPQKSFQKFAKTYQTRKLRRNSKWDFLGPATNTRGAAMWEVKKKRQKSLSNASPTSVSPSRSWLLRACWPCVGKLVTWSSRYQTEPAWVHASDFCLCFYYTNATNSVFARLNWRLSCLKSQRGELLLPLCSSWRPRVRL